MIALSLVPFAVCITFWVSEPACGISQDSHPGPRISASLSGKAQIEMDIRPKPNAAAYMLLSVFIACAIWGTIGPPKPCRERPIGTPRMSKVGMCGSIARAR
jgi:hypothetical protein